MPDPGTPVDENSPISNIGVTATGEIKEVTVAKDNRKEVLNDAFMLGWLIIELKSRIQIALVHPHDSGILQSSIWRSIVNKISFMQAKAFPACTTAQTLYEPPSADALPYLYPPEPDYANVGIPEHDATGAPILKDFKLYDVTRRAINCLTLLYIKEEESLVPDMVRKHQRILVAEILKAAENTGEGGGDTDPKGDLAADPVIVIDGQKTAGTQADKDLVTAIDVLTKRTVKFLDAWDGYLRENYYAGGIIPQDENELIAYEAGRAMSLLPWSISVMLVPLLEQKTKKPAELSGKFLEAWQTVFRPQVIVRLQHQISSLSCVLDDWYMTKNNIVRKTDEDLVMVMPDANLPSQAILAVKQSLNFWQRTVEWVSKIKEDQLRKPGSDGVPGWSEPMRLALIEQANIWQTLMTGQQSLNAFNMESITRKLMGDVTADIQKSLHKDFKGSFKKVEASVSEMAGEVKEAVNSTGKTAINGLEEMYTTFKWIIWPAVGVILLIVLVCVVFLLKSNKESWENMSGLGFSGLFSTLLGYFGLNRLGKVKASKKEAIDQQSEEAKSTIDAQASKSADSGSAQAQQGFLSRVQGAAQETGKMVLEAFDRGYKQIKIELSGMSRSTAVSYPLVEFFGITFKLDNEDEFLTQIIWNGTTRDEQLKRVTSAAFGPIAIFINPDEASDGGKDN